ncbi:MAG: sulfotransferase [Bacteroidetes bacterium]|nr:sulfotransferase [Bacteroidota bacterium]
MSDKQKEEEYELKDHQLYISSIRLLFRLFRNNEISGKYRKRMFRIITVATLTQPFQWLQRLIIWPRLRKVDFKGKPPTFVIGHWRSGTTHLHYLLSRDPHFGYLTNYQALFLRISFLGQGFLDRILDRFMPETRPQDNIKMNAYEPAEEEQPMTNLTECSGMQSMYFPQNQSYYEKYNLFMGISPREKRKWRRKYRYMLKLISLANKNKPLLLKNPHNTSRIKELLELFPGAKFIYIHRHPFDVYLSNLHLYEKTISTQYLNEFSDEEVKERVINNYVTTMKKYLEERDLIPEGDLIEISFKELEADAEGTVRRLYNELNIPNYDKAIVPIREYLDTVKDYKKNVFREPEPQIAERLLKEWGFAFEEWNYPAYREA